MKTQSHSAVETQPPAFVGFATALGAAILLRLVCLAAPPTYGATLVFDGADDYVCIADTDALDLTNNYTLECWFKADSFSNLRGLISKYQASEQNGYVLRLTGTDLSFDEQTTTGLNLQTGCWYHVAAVNSNGVRRLYLDGVLTNLTGTALAVKANNNELRFASDYTGRCFDGQIDEVRIWNVVRTAAEINGARSRRLIGNEPGLVAYYPMDEGEGTLTADATGHGLSGALINGVLWNPAEDAVGPAALTESATLVTSLGAQLNAQVNTNGAPTTNWFEYGASSPALGFDGVDDYVAFAGEMPSLPAANSPYTIEAWIKPTVMNNGGIVGWGKYDVNNQVNALRLYDGGLYHYWWNNDLAASTGPLTEDWHHVAATFDGTTRRILLDGKVVVSDKPTAHNVTTITNFTIGKTSTAGEFFKGQIDEVRIWNIPRSEAEIRQTQYAHLAGNEPGLVAYYRLDEGAGATTAYATTSPGLTGTLVNGPTWVLGAWPVFDQATIPQPVAGTNSVLNLDGVSTYVDAPDSAWFGGSHFTIEAQVYLRNYGNWSRVIDFGNAGGVDSVLLALSDGTSGQFVFSVHRGSSEQKLLSPVKVPLNQWWHLAATYEGTTATLFLNGIAVASGPIHNPQGVTRTNNFIGGRYWSDDTRANAMFDNVRIWMVVFSTVLREWMNQPASTNHPNWSALEAEWRFDETTGTTALDSSPNARHATLMSGAGRLSGIPVSATLTELTPGTLYHFRSFAQNENGFSVGNTKRLATPAPGGGTALEFYGVNDYVRVANFGNRMPTNEVTVEFWQRAHTAKAQNTFCLDPNDGNNRFQAHVPYGDGVVYWDFGNVTQGRLSYTPPVSPVGTWQHFTLVAKYSSTASERYMRIYRNGVLEASKADAKAFNPGQYDLTIGKGSDGYFGGDLDELRIWNVALTEQQILDTWHTRLLATNLAEAYPNLVAYYRMDEGASSALHDAITNANDALLVNGPLWNPSTAPIGSPQVRTEDAMDVTSTGATFHGRVTPGGSGDAYWFECGTDGIFGLTSPTQWVSSGNSVLNLDGADDYVDVPDGLWFEYNFTVEAEVFLRGYGANTRVFDFGNGSPSDNVLLLLSAGKFEYHVYRGTSREILVSPVPLPTNQWCHVAVTHQGNTATLLLNGVVVASGSVWRANYVPNRTNNFIGRSNWSGEPYANAMFDNVRIWDTALAPDTLRAWIGVPVTAAHPNRSDLAAEWRFDETDGTTATDSSGGGHDGTLINGASRLPLVPVAASVTGLNPGTVYQVRCVTKTPAASPWGKQTASSPSLRAAARR